MELRDLEPEPAQEGMEQVDLPHIRRVHDAGPIDFLQETHEMPSLLRLVRGVYDLEMKIRPIHPRVDDVRFRQAERCSHVADPLWRRRFREREDRRPGG